ncbi:MAG: MATE family efflux transporter [Clostridiales bacterium]|jgi:putative MATE family efflux protein|nr:MATE family efflux transporter [Clostridiales bacterium]
MKISSKIIIDKKFYIKLLSLVLPILIQDLLRNGLNFVDNILVGKISEIDLASVNLATQPFFLFGILIFGLASGGTVLIAQYHGKNDFKAINKIIHTILGISLLFSLITAAFVVLMPEQIMKIYTKDLVMVKKGAEYLKIAGYSILLYGYSSSTGLILRSIKKLKVTTIINSVSFILNFFLDIALIFGKWGFPELKISGAAYATLGCRIFEAIVFTLYLNFCDKKIKIRLKNFFYQDKILLKDFFKYSLPITINEFIWGLGIVVLPIIFARMGSNAVAASGIVNIAESIIIIVVISFASAVGIIIGNETGVNNYKYVIKCAYTTLILSIIVGLFFSSILFFFRDIIINFYSLDPKTILSTRNLMAILSFITLIDHICIITIVGIFRGAGDTMFAMLIDVLTLWIIAIPAAFLAFFFSASIEVIYLCARLDIIAKAILCILRFKSKKWIHNVTRQDTSEIEKT